MARIITDYLDQAAARFPDKTAFADPQRCVTFSEAQKESQAVASGLIRTGLFRKPAAIFLDKGINCITCMLGVAYSGNFYTVMDTKMFSVS